MLYKYISLKKINKQIFYFISLISLAFNANALVILQTASASSSVDYDNNVTMSENPQSVWRYSIVPNYRAELNDDLNRWFANGSINIQRSSDRILSIDREDPTVGVGWSRELYRGNFTLTGNYSRSSTRVTELQSIGLLSTDASSVVKNISADWSQSLTDRIILSLEGGYSKSSFTGGGLTDFSSKSLNSSMSYEWSERFRPFINLGYTTYSQDGQNQTLNNIQNQDDSNALTYTAGASYNINERLTSTFSAGVTRLSKDYGEVGSFSFDYLGDKYLIKGTLARSVTPSGVGGFQNADTASLNYDYTLSDKSSIAASFSWQKNNSLNDVESKQISAFYSRSLSEYWQMRLSLQMRDIKSNNQSSNGEIFGISLIYNTLEF